MESLDEGPSTSSRRRIRRSPFGHLPLLPMASILIATYILASHITGIFAEGHEKEVFTEYTPGFCRDQQILSSNIGAVRHCMEFNPLNLRGIFTIFIMISYGAFVRTICRLFKISLPYTVILLISGMIFGIGTHFQNICPEYATFTKIARMSPHLIFYIFLPVLIFESAFNMKAHVFFRSVAQVLILAVPGMLISTFITALITMQFLSRYDWTFVEACLFGAIISATDPVAVVAILRELGTSETLSTMIEGESLLNDGVAILLFEVFKTFVEVDFGAEEGKSNLDWGLYITRMFFQIAIGGPIFGFVMGKIFVTFLQRIFNDATVEITLTLIAAYLTYFIGEAFLGVSGVMAVVALGIVMSAEKTCISPEVEPLCHHFWEMLGYLANTVLFFLVGILITETAISSARQGDAFYLGFLYFGLNVVRLGMIGIMSPILSRIGYGMTWQQAVVIMWGGLRGAVGICLALEIYKEKHFCIKATLGPKFLLQTAGIVILTLIVNGTTTKKLLDMLKVTEISIGRLQDMSNAVRQMTAAQLRTIAMLKHDRFLADSKWEVVEKFTNVADPYRIYYKKKEYKPDVKKPPSGAEMITQDLEKDLNQAEIQRQTMTRDGDDMLIQPTLDDYRAMTEEARLRLLKALKVSFWHQFEKGVLTEQGVQILNNIAEATEDRPLTIIHASRLRKYWSISTFWTKVKNGLNKIYEKMSAKPQRPEAEWRWPMWRFTTSDWFDLIMMIIIFLNFIPITWETYYDISNIKLNERETLGFLVVSCAFTLIYTAEFVFKIIGRGCGDYWTSCWNYIDFGVLIMSYVDIATTIVYLTGKNDGNVNFGPVKVMRIVRIVRSIRLIRPVMPGINKFIQNQIHRKLFLGYDVAKGFVTAIDDVIKFLPQMVDNKKIHKRLKHLLEAERLIVLREMGILSKNYPGIAVAVKTRHASRAILNHMRETLRELKEDGLLDEKECSLLTEAIEEKMKRLWYSPPNIKAEPPESLLENISWVQGNDKLLKFIFNNASLLKYAKDDIVCLAGEPANGIYIIVNGMVKEKYIPTDKMLNEMQDFGKMPNMEIFQDMDLTEEMEDFITIGGIIGELGVLTRTPRAATISCLTSVMCYHLPQATMEKAINDFKEEWDSLKARLWRSYGNRLCSAFLPNQPLFASWTMDKIRVLLERSAVPVGDQFNSMTIPDFIEDSVVIHGTVTNFHTKEIYIAPCLIPRNCVKILLNNANGVESRVLVVAHEEIEEEKEHEEDEKQLHNVVTTQQQDKGDSGRKSFDKKKSTSVTNSKKPNKEPATGPKVKKNESTKSIQSTNSKQSKQKVHTKKTS